MSPPHTTLREFFLQAMANAESGSFYLRWKSHGKNAPSSSMIRGSAVVNGTIAYFNSATSKTIYGYDTASEMWFSLPNCPQQCFALVVLKGVLTAVGGFCRIQATNKLQTLIEKDSASTRGSATWTDSKYPPMPTMRGRVAAVTTEDNLIVAGGQLAVVTQIGGVLRRVEIMDLNTQQWFRACSLPYELTEPSMTLCGSRLYIMGGWASNDRTKSVLSCDLQALVESRSARSASPISPSARLESSVWNEVADIPSYASTSLAVNGDILLGIGGCDENESPTDAIYWYNPKANLWSCVGHMQTKRFRALATVLPPTAAGDKPQLMVIGGSSSADGALSGKGEIAELVIPS